MRGSPGSKCLLRPELRVLAVGTFDIVHAGHVRFLEAAASFGRLTVGVNSDRFVATFKAAPANTFERRVAVLAALRCVEEVVENDGAGAELIREVRPDVLAVGPDWFARDYMGQIGMTLDELLGQGTTLAFLPPPRERGLSSSELRGVA